MADTKKVIRMLNNTLRHCHNLYNHVTSEEQTWLAEINQGAKEALELLKENDIELERIHQNICAYINDGCSTDTEADKEYVCSQIDRIFEGKKAE